MGIIYQTNKKTGITYAYSNEAYWDKEKQQSRAKRTLLGKVDPVTGEIVPTRSYKKKKGNSVEPAKRGPVPITKFVTLPYTTAGRSLQSIGCESTLVINFRNSGCKCCIIRSSRGYKQNFIDWSTTNVPI